VTAAIQAAYFNDVPTFMTAMIRIDLRMSLSVAARAEFDVYEGMLDPGAPLRDVDLDVVRQKVVEMLALMADG